MPIINEIRYFTGGIGYIVEATGYDKFDEVFVETSSRVIGVVCISYNNSYIVYTGFNLNGNQIFSKEYLDNGIEFSCDEDEDILEFLNSKEFLSLNL